MLKGIAASDGIAIGRVLLLKKEIPVIMRTVIPEAEISSQLPDIIDGIGSVDPFEFVTEKSDESYEYSIGYNQ